MDTFIRTLRTTAGLIFISMLSAAPLLAATPQNGNGTIPYHFKDGEVISADVMNDMFNNIKNVVEGFSSPEELTGIWSCTTYTAEANCGVSGFSLTPRGILKSKAQDITFTCDATSCRWTAAEFWPGSCLSDFTYGRQLVQRYDLSGYVIISLPAPMPDNTWIPSGQVHSYRKLGPNVFIWNITGSLPATSFASCEKQLLPPTIPADLAATVDNGKVSLTWTDTSSDETAFVLFRKAGETGAWAEVGTVPANTTTFSETLSAGNYSYRVAARNANGDSLGSNMTVVVIP